MMETRGIATFGACLLALLAVACNRRPADEAIKAAERALAAAPEIEMYLPEEVAAVASVLREARASLDAGLYTDALRAALPLPDRIAAAAQQAGKHKQKATAAWNELSASLPAHVDAIATRLSMLASSSAISSERLTAAQAELAALNQAWAGARTAYAIGDVPRAVAAARDLKAEAESLAGRLGLKRAPGVTAPPSSPSAR